MKWFNKWLLNRIKIAAKSEQNSNESPGEYGAKYSNSVAVAKHPSSALEHDNTIRFNVYPASGGRVVQTNRYDKQRDRSTTGLYVITSDQDFGKEIDKIITMESLKS